MARTDYGAILSTVIKDTSDAIREVNGTSSLIAPNGWGSAIRTMHSDSDYENVIDQLIEETASGDIASFSDGANNLPCEVTCTLNPVQDLHGQDNPYPAGGGKNKCDMTSNPIVLSSTGNIGNQTCILPSGTYTFSWTSSNSTAVALKVYNGETSIASVSSTGSISGRGSLNFTISQSSTHIRAYFNGATSISDIQVESGSTATAFAPYSNICPITGHDHDTVTQLGANIWDEQTEQGAYNNQGEKIAYAVLRNKNPIKVEGIPSVYFHCGTSGVTARVVFYTKTMTCISSTPGTVLNSVISVPNNASYMSFNLDTNYGTTYGNNVSINAPSSYTQYNAYNPTNTTITFPDTVYGGSHDVGSGLLSNNRGYVDLGTLNWSYYEYGGQGGGYANDINTIVKTTPQYEKTTAISDQLNVVADSGFDNTPNYSFCINSYGMIKVRCFSATDRATLISALSGIHLCYPLKTPTTTQLTPEQLNSILGENNFYHDGNGEIQVQYYANGELYVQQHS